MSTTDIDAGYPLTAFSTIDNLFQSLETARGQGLVVGLVSQQAYEDICAERAARGRKYRFTLYLASFQALIISMPNPRHDSVSRHFESFIARQVDAMGLKEDWLYEDSKTYYHRSNGVLFSSGEGNSVGRPRSLRPSRHDWPTIAVECGPSKSMSLLREKAIWWLGASGHDVKVVVLLEVDKITGRITIEKWKTVQRGRSPVSSPRVVQTVTIRKFIGTSDTIPRPSYVVCHGPLWLDFSHLFLRLPREDSAEGHVEINNDDLLRLAEATWSADGGIGEG